MPTAVEVDGTQIWLHHSQLLHQETAWILATSGLTRLLVQPGRVPKKELGIPETRLRWARVGGHVSLTPSSEIPGWNLFLKEFVFSDPTVNNRASGLNRRKPRAAEGSKAAEKQASQGEKKGGAEVGPGEKEVEQAGPGGRRSRAGPGEGREAGPGEKEGERAGGPGGWASSGHFQEESADLSVHLLGDLRASVPSGQASGTQASFTQAIHSFRGPWVGSLPGPQPQVPRTTGQATCPSPGPQPQVLVSRTMDWATCPSPVLQAQVQSQLLEPRTSGQEEMNVNCENDTQQELKMEVKYIHESDIIKVCIKKSLPRKKPTKSPLKADSRHWVLEPSRLSHLGVRSPRPPSNESEELGVHHAHHPSKRGFRSGARADPSSLQSVAGDFVWVVRDFILELMLDGRTITEDEYLENALKVSTHPRGQQPSPCGGRWAGGMDTICHLVLELGKPLGRGGNIPVSKHPKASSQPHHGPQA
ncbi:hypothetical protein QTO34_018384 [Cnephaeus nilssonii]|uniref:Guanylate-binding protein N-terminal domain-containing protein n=1 Tax=Cnephaeus nilssonii TaxID=3371016 RepID=A0AA40LQ52_CNENI|nr:hypothetical protein QTO34_018384 [Eptesicus nilssonii]